MSIGLKIIHTSDWHLGKKLIKIERSQEQQLFLNWLSNLIVEKGVDILLVSGDIFDSPSPSNDAITSYFNFLKNVYEKSKCKIFIISGNHDSGKFLEAPQKILYDLGVNVCGKLLPLDNKNFLKNHKYTISKDDFKVNIVSLPYFRGHELYNMMKASITEDSSRLKIDHESFVSSSLTKFFSTLIPTRKNNEFNILMIHHLFEGYELAGSEQIISLSGVDGISRKLVDNYFDYIALGHIHKKMKLNNQSTYAYYSGSPLPHRFGEHPEKKIILLDLNFTDNAFDLRVNEVSIPKFRQIISIDINEENYNDKLEKLITEYQNEKYSPFIEVKIYLRSPNNELIDLVTKKLSIFDTRYIFIHPHFHKSYEDKSPITSYDMSNNNLLELFDIFYKTKFPNSTVLDNKILNSFKELLANANHLENDNLKENLHETP